MMLRRPTIEEARHACESHRARAAILIVFGDGHYAASSYGETKPECASTGQTLDAILKAFDDGGLPAPEVR